MDAQLAHALEAAISPLVADAARRREEPGPTTRAVVAAVLKLVPPPPRPDAPVLEDVDSQPHQAHDWGERWEGGNHNGRTCRVCGSDSACTWCKPDALEVPDCLRQQAAARNHERRRDYRRAVERYDAQMEYYRTIAGAGA